MRRGEPLTELALTQACGYCGARPGDWCVTARGDHLGARAVWLHQDRQAVVWAAWRAGSTEGQAWGLKAALGAIDGAQRWSWITQEREAGRVPTFATLREYLAGQLERDEKWRDRALEDAVDTAAQIIA